MTLDRSIKPKAALTRMRSVLTRAERIEKLKEQDAFDADEQSPLGLQKVRVYKLQVKKKKKVKAPEEEGDKKKKKK
ncbi:Small basic protein [Planctomycetales bacterium 10988]|nr:Small basic protein [Planctomycetales bacterium 10988]